MHVRGVNSDTSDAVSKAAAAYEKALAHRAEQHRYIAQAQREVAARRSILPNLESDVERARVRLAVAQGLTAAYPTSAAHRDAQREVELAQHAARYPNRALADASLPHHFSGNIFGDECWVGQLHDGGACGFRPGPEGISDDTHVRG